MKFAAFTHEGTPMTGVVEESGERIVPYPGISDMLDLILQYSGIRSGNVPTGAAIAIADVTLTAPIPVPRRNVFCVGKNYAEHAREFSGSGFEAGATKGNGIDEFPAVFSKGPNTVTGPFEDVRLHADVTASVDYEAELALIIGKGGINIAEGDAYGHIFGYTIVNDVTARDRQKNHKQWFLGKTLDTFCPMGPWITTADELDPENLEVVCRVNGEVRQAANTRDLVFSIPRLISTISAGMALVPGDIIATGTPAGVGIGFTPPKFLHSGDVVTIEISKLGKIENRFV